MTALTKLTTTETKLFFRDPMNVGVGLGLAPVLLIALGLIPSFREPSADLGGLRVIDLYVPIAVALAIATFALTILPQLTAGYRAKGVLRRMRTTPITPATLLGAQLLMCTAMTVGLMVALLAIARLAFAAPVPQNVLGYLVSFVLATAATGAVGLIVAALAPSSMSASGIGMVLFFPMLFFAGLWIPREKMNAVLLTISDFSPLGAGVASLQDAAAGDWPQLLHLAVMLGWTIVAGALAARFFRWE
ncbi:ABC transporter permease [Agromyces laixinhei]|uniref:ABC transporter permease n=1 Tax=Agromyces laixinhei TaxID=2585717 RepID=UPI001115D568|nr:ABC transporter permease [Agromyces laixinhei]